LVHSYGAVLDNPQLVVMCVVGDGEAETGPLAASWHSNKFVNPALDGAVLPVLNLNGYKIAGPTVLARIPQDELADLMRGYGHEPLFVTGDEPAEVHELLATAMDRAMDLIASVQADARSGRAVGRPRWPMIVLRTPKGWTGPAVVDGLPVEGTWRAHQVPLAETRSNPEHRAQLETWMRSYRPEMLFDQDGRLVPELQALAPTGARCMSANAHANGGLLMRDLVMPDFRDFAVPVQRPAAGSSQATRVLGDFLAGVIARNPDRFRLMALTRPPPTGCPACSRRRTGPGTPLPCPVTITSHPTAGSWRCCRNISARDGSRDICSPGAMACSTATRRSSTSSTRCSTSTPSG
jgi:xylulose-5-phosphate/fructose-6-phosphate phosphoketolase